MASFQKVQLVGRFDHSSEVYVGARGMPGTNAETARGSGYIILTPMVLEAGGRRVLVNRGWVERGFKQPASRPAGQPEGVVAVEAVGALAPPLLSHPAAPAAGVQLDRTRTRHILMRCLM